MKTECKTRNRFSLWLGIPLLAGIMAVSPLALAQQGGGKGAGMQSGQGMMGGKGQGMQSGDQARDRMQDMDRLRDRIHQTDDPAERRRLMNEYHNRIQQGMRNLDNRSGPGPNATQQERMQHMENRMNEMHNMMRHMWEYQDQRGAGGNSGN